jgi:hypothetical protein
VVSKPQIAVKGKAQPDEKAQHIQLYVSILKKAATPPSGVRWGFETTCRKYLTRFGLYSEWNIGRC